MTFVSIHSNRLWAGQRPRVAARLLRRARLGFDVQSLVALAWAALAQASPRLLRALLGGIVRLRNLSVGKTVRRGETYDWRPHVRPEPVPRRAAASPAALR
jgi:hypothetical protein